MIFPFAPIYTAAMSLLPPAMDSAPARTMLVAIGLQESRFTHRRQVGGPARGFWQFELGGGVRGVLTHQATKPIIRAVLERLQYDFDPATSYAAIEHNDVLACIYARLLLWALPYKLPVQGEVESAWGQYLAAWRPGKPHRETWDVFFNEAWGVA